MKNPWLSMWLSGVNAWSGAARSMVAAETRRAQNAMMKEAARQAAEFWSPPSSGDRPASQKAKTRRSSTRRRKSG